MKFKYGQMQAISNQNMPNEQAMSPLPPDSALGPNRKQRLIRQNLGHSAIRLLLSILDLPGPQKLVLNGESRPSAAAKQPFLSTAPPPHAVSEIIDENTHS